MLDKQELKQYVRTSLKVKESELMWSDKSINPTEEYIKDMDTRTLVPRSLGYWVLKI